MPKLSLPRAHDNHLRKSYPAPHLHHGQNLLHPGASLET